MKGPLHAIRRRRSERPANGVETAQAATEAPTEALPAAGPSPAPPQPAGEQTAPTAEQPTVAAVPAGQEPVPARPSFRQRGRLRRRLRYLRRVRELGFRDLGGLVFDQHRFSRVNTTLVDGKLHALSAVDAELRALEHALDDRRPLTELREPGISVCSRCGALHGSEARFCPSCGTPVSGPRAIAEVGEAVTLPGGEARAPGTPPPPAQPVAPAPLQLQPLAPERQPAAPGEATAGQPHAAAPGEATAGQPHAAAPGEATAGQPHTAAPGEAAAGHPHAAAPGEAPAGHPHTAEPAAAAAEPAHPAAAPVDGEQPTEVMRRVDDKPADAAEDREAVAQRSGERRES
jgi:ribosomal protein L40E